MRRILTVFVLGACPMAASAALPPEREALTRCLVNFVVAEQMILDPAPGQSAEDALAALEPDLAAAARGLKAMQQSALRDLNAWAEAEGLMNEVLATYREQEGELFAMLDETSTEEGEAAVADYILDLVEQCQERFPDL